MDYYDKFDDSAKKTLKKNGSYTNLLNKPVKKKENSNYIEFFKYEKPSYQVSTTCNINSSNESDSILLLDVNNSLPNQFAAVKSNFEVDYLEITNNGVRSLNKMKEHTGRINDTCFLKNTENNDNFKNAFFTVSDDSCVKLWDVRSPTSAHTIKTPALSIDSSNKFIAVGTTKELILYDLTTMKEYKKSKFFHSGDINSLLFVNHNDSELLFTGGDDNIINLIDISEGLTTNSIHSTANIGQSVQWLNYLDSDYNFMQAVTTVNTYNVVNLNRSSSIFEFDAKNETYNTDYVLNSFPNLSNNQIVLVCGNFQGSIVFLNIIVSNTDMELTYDSQLSVGHSTCINSLELINNSMFIAGCDEGNVYVIQRSQHLSNADLEALAESADSDEKKAKLGPMKLKNKNKYGKFFKPY